MNKRIGRKQKKMKKQNKSGITLIALIITIIILLILAAIVINLTIGQRGILRRSEEAGRNYMTAAEEEDRMLSNLLGEIDNPGGEEEIPDPTPKEYFDFDPATGSIAIKNAASYYGRDEGVDLGLKELVIPAEIDGVTVKCIGMNCKVGVNSYGDIHEIIGFPRLLGVEKVVIPSTVEIIKKEGFVDCKDLVQVELSNGLKEVWYQAFYRCSRLNSITLPKSVTRIYDAFMGCSSLESINVDLDNTVYASVDGMLLNKEKTEVIRCPERKEGM